MPLPENNKLLLYSFHDLFYSSAETGPHCVLPTSLPFIADTSFPFIKVRRFATFIISLLAFFLHSHLCVL